MGVFLMFAAGFLTGVADDFLVVLLGTVFFEPMGWATMVDELLSLRSYGLQRQILNRNFKVKCQEYV